jgi:sulfhydrogenase subunit beta (sulfur reductase)
MRGNPAESSEAVWWLAREAFPRLLSALAARGYRTVGPVVRDGSVTLETIARMEDLPRGWRDWQEGGVYRLEPQASGRLFDVVNGPESLKRFTFAPREPLLQIEIAPGAGGSFRVQELTPEPERIAVLGVRACDLAALAIQDRIFLHDRAPDAQFAARRRGLLLAAVQCTRSVATCFCASLGTGPAVEQGFDLALTEIDAGFVVRAGSAAGTEILAGLALARASHERHSEAQEAVERCARTLQRRLDVRDLPALLYDNLEHPRWDDVAARCLSCGNCTMVCPTCFCHDERDEPSLDGARSLRVREWDSCFNRDHGQIRGHNFRPQIRDRYRQWLVHKVASWIDQFGTSGCVGCGRCITWCPVAIDLTEEVAAIRGEP